LCARIQKTRIEELPVGRGIQLLQSWERRRLDTQGSSLLATLG
jgi:hypothetical protein